jgi:hypothetical protein
LALRIWRSCTALHCSIDKPEPEAQVHANACGRREVAANLDIEKSHLYGGEKNIATQTVRHAEFETHKRWKVKK